MKKEETIGTDVLKEVFGESFVLASKAKEMEVQTYEANRRDSVIKNIMGIRKYMGFKDWTWSNFVHWYEMELNELIQEENLWEEQKMEWARRNGHISKK